MEIDELRRKMEEYAASRGYKLNPDAKIVGMILKGLLAKEKKHGKIYCPCRAVTDNEEQNKRIVCPCAYHEQEINEGGKCFCGLFVRGSPPYGKNLH